MSTRRTATKPHYTAEVIRRLATANNVTVVMTANDVFAQHVTRHRVQAVRLQARYLRESRP
ncbi:hypothetical protein [Bradyrhizobium sp. CCBAU 53415]|uniref:hypothetical protein n=1 Tax=Bradyrhizobium sp. CCBAU 53415 TaxID=1325119 RepID=UPI0023056E9E|nr:hypothetical protein [Bradyrhizobium sp. CCBAU 53415]